MGVLVSPNHKKKKNGDLNKNQGFTGGALLQQQKQPHLLLPRRASLLSFSRPGNRRWSSTSFYLVSVYHNPHFLSSSLRFTHATSSVISPSQRSELRTSFMELTYLCRAVTPRMSPRAAPIGLQQRLPPVPRCNHLHHWQAAASSTPARWRSEYPPQLQEHTKSAVVFALDLQA